MQATDPFESYDRQTDRRDSRTDARGHTFSIIDDFFEVSHFLKPDTGKCPTKCVIDTYTISTLKSKRMDGFSNRQRTKEPKALSFNIVKKVKNLGLRSHVLLGEI